MRNNGIPIPYANFSVIRTRMHTGTPYAYGDPHMQNYTYGDTKLNFLCMRTTSLCMYGEWLKNPHMHTGMHIPVCIRGLVSIRSLYAYRDRENPNYILIPGCIPGLTCVPCMHTGIDLDPRMHTSIPICIRGLILIPICIQGSHVM